MEPERSAWRLSNVTPIRGPVARRTAVRAAFALTAGAAALTVAAYIAGASPTGPVLAPETAPAEEPLAAATVASPWVASTPPGAAAVQLAEQLAAADAAAMLASFPVPPVARRLGAAPPSPGDVLRNMGSYARAVGQPDFDQLHLDGWWLAAGAPLTVLGWVDKHLPHQYTYVGRGSFYDSWSDSFTLPGLPAGVISGRDLEVDVVPAGHGQTAIGVRAMVAYAQGPAGR
jgi:hypothetical protein